MPGRSHAMVKLPPQFITGSCYWRIYGQRRTQEKNCATKTSRKWPVLISSVSHITLRVNAKPPQYTTKQHWKAWPSMTETPWISLKNSLLYHPPVTKAYGRNWIEILTEEFHFFIFSFLNDKFQFLKILFVCRFY